MSRRPFKDAFEFYTTQKHSTAKVINKIIIQKHSITDSSGMLLKPCATFKREKKGSQNHMSLKTKLTDKI